VSESKKAASGINELQACVNYVGNTVAKYKLRVRGSISKLKSVEKAKGQCVVTEYVVTAFGGVVARLHSRNVCER
jgi:hypothetical protein